MTLVDATEGLKATGSAEFDESFREDENEQL
jgi:hypothetical protein